MNVRRGMVGVVVTIVALGFAAAGALAGSGGVWVSSDGETHGIHNGGKVVLVGGGEGFDLSQLADGETRVFGSGERAVTTTRRGDVATITRAAISDTEEALDMSCNLAQDKCRIVTSETQPDRVMIIVQKERTCVNGEGDCAEVSLDGIDALPGDGQQIMLRKVLRCEDPDQCEESEDISHGMLRIEGIEGEMPGDHLLFMSPLGGAVHPGTSEFIVMPRGDSVLLRCPEGDSTLRVKKDEAQQVYLCPKHSQPMQKVEPRSGVKQRIESEPRSH